AVAVAVVDLAVGAPDEAVQVVAGEVEPDAVAAAQLGARLGLLVAGEFPETRDVGEPDFAAAREDAGGDAVERGVEAIGVDAALVRDAVVIGVLEHAENLALDRK